MFITRRYYCHHFNVINVQSFNDIQWNVHILKGLGYHQHEILGRPPPIFVEDVSLLYSAVLKFHLIYIAIHTHYHNISLRYLCTVDMCLRFVADIPNELGFFYMFSYRDTMTNILSSYYTNIKWFQKDQTLFF